MVAKVTNPSGVTDDAVIVDMEECLYGIYFTPKEPGKYTISIRHKDIHIPGSPFQYTVGAMTNFGAHKVHAGGLGLERGAANEFSKHFFLLLLFMQKLLIGSVIKLFTRLCEYE